MDAQQLLNNNVPSFLSANSYADINKDKWQERRNKGHSLTKIASDHGVSRYMVAKFTDEPETPVRNKYDKDDFKRWQEKRNKGMKIKEISKEEGACTVTICRNTNRRDYKGSISAHMVRQHIRETPQERIFITDNGVIVGEYVPVNKDEDNG